jgi:hypothetical protein
MTRGPDEDRMLRPSDIVLGGIPHSLTPTSHPTIHSVVTVQRGGGRCAAPGGKCVVAVQGGVVGVPSVCGGRAAAWICPEHATHERHEGSDRFAYVIKEVSCRA